MVDTFRKSSGWATRVQAGSPGSIALRFESIGLHLAQCRRCQGHWFKLLCAIDAVDRFVAPRLITTLVGVVAVCATLVALA